MISSTQQRGTGHLYDSPGGVGRPSLNPKLHHYTYRNPIKVLESLGPFTIQFGAGGTLGGGAGFTATSGLAISYSKEKGWHRGLYSNMGGGGHGGGSFSAIYEVLYSANDEISDLAGGSTSIGGSVNGELFGAGPEINIMHDGAAPSEGIVFGIGRSTIVEEHGYVTHTTIIPFW